MKTLNVAYKRLQPFKGRYELKKDNANNLSFKDNTFDAVFCAATLHHIGFMLFLKEDRNMWLMRRNNFFKWLKEAGLRNIDVENLIYTPPAPRFFIPVYNFIDRICHGIPLILRCSLMLLGSGVK